MWRPNKIQSVGPSNGEDQTRRKCRKMQLGQDLSKSQIKRISRPKRYFRDEVPHMTWTFLSTADSRDLFSGWEPRAQWSKRNLDLKSYLDWSMVSFVSIFRKNLHTSWRGVGRSSWFSPQKKTAQRGARTARTEQNPGSGLGLAG